MSSSYKQAALCLWEWGLQLQIHMAPFSAFTIAVDIANWEAHHCGLGSFLAALESQERFIILAVKRDLLFLQVLLIATPSRWVFGGKILFYFILLRTTDLQRLCSVFRVRLLNLGEEGRKIESSSSCIEGKWKWRQKTISCCIVGTEDWNSYHNAHQLVNG